MRDASLFIRHTGNVHQRGKMAVWTLEQSISIRNWKRESKDQAGNPSTGDSELF